MMDRPPHIPTQEEQDRAREAQLLAANASLEATLRRATEALTAARRSAPTTPATTPGSTHGYGWHDPALSTVPPTPDPADSFRTGPIFNPDVDPFLNELGVGDSLPNEFMALTPEQQAKVVADLKKRIVDIVKFDAEAEYANSKAARGKIRFKATAIKNLEKDAYEDLTKTVEGRQLVINNINILVKRIEKQKVQVGPNGKLNIQYAAIENATPAENAILENFSVLANNFANISYEWGQETKNKGVDKFGVTFIVQEETKNKGVYERAKAAYAEARAEVMRIKLAKGEDADEIMAEMLEIDNAITLEQFLNTYPEVENTIAGFGESAGLKEKALGGWNAIKKVTGKDWKNRAIFAGGYLVRTGTKAIIESGRVLGFGFGLGAMVGGIVGGVKSRTKAKETLQDRNIQARHGKVDESKSRLQTVDATHLSEKLNALISEVENISTIVDPRIRTRRLALLATRIDHTRGKIDRGEVNFGDARSSLDNLFNLTNALNRAQVLEASLDENVYKDLKNKIDRLVVSRGEKIESRVEEMQKRFIRWQTVKGFTLGATIFGAGYGIRWIHEHSHDIAEFIRAHTPTLNFHGVPNVHEDSLSAEVNANRAININPFEGRQEPQITFEIPQNVELGVSQNAESLPGFVPQPTMDQLDSLMGIGKNGITFHEGDTLSSVLDKQLQIFQDQYAGHPGDMPDTVQELLKRNDPVERLMRLQNIFRSSGVKFYDPTTPDGNPAIPANYVFQIDTDGKIHFGPSDNIKLLEHDAIGTPSTVAPASVPTTPHATERFIPVGQQPSTINPAPSTVPSAHTAPTYEQPPQNISRPTAPAQPTYEQPPAQVAPRSIPQNRGSNYTFNTTDRTPGQGGVNYQYNTNGHLNTPDHNIASSQVTPDVPPMSPSDPSFKDFIAFTGGGNPEHLSNAQLQDAFHNYSYHIYHMSNGDGKWWHDPKIQSIKVIDLLDPKNHATNEIKFRGLHTYILSIKDKTGVQIEYDETDGHIKGVQNMEMNDTVDTFIKRGLMKAAKNPRGLQGINDQYDAQMSSYAKMDAANHATAVTAAPAPVATPTPTPSVTPPAEIPHSSSATSQPFAVHINDVNQNPLVEKNFSNLHIALVAEGTPAQIDQKWAGIKSEKAQSFFTERLRESGDSFKIKVGRYASSIGAKADIQPKNNETIDQFIIRALKILEKNKK